MQNPHPLPPLPIVDGTSIFGLDCQALIFDNSSLEDWQICKRLYQFKQLDRLIAPGKRAGANFGSGCHRGWETRYRTIGPGRVTADVEAAMNDAITRHFTANPQPEGDFRTADHCIRYMGVYNTLYPIEPFQVFSYKGAYFVERSFAFPFGTIGGYLCVYAGKIDMAVTTPDLRTWDNKTTFQFGEGMTLDWQQNGGQRGYVWAFHEATGTWPRGYIINACRVRRPSKKDLYGESVPVDSTDFMRIPFDVTIDMIDDWKQDTSALIEEVIWSHGRGYFPCSRKSCSGKYGPCDYSFVCTTMPHAQRQVLLDRCEPNDWTPLNKPQ